MERDSPLRWIRKQVFGATQAELAAIGGVSRTRVTRYEVGGEDPPLPFLRKLRSAALERGAPFSGDWFFAIPDPGAQGTAAADNLPEDVQ